jgi:hypothetical protein
VSEVSALLFSVGLLSLLLCGYFFGLSDGLKKEKRPETEFEIKPAVGCLILGGLLIGFGL